MKEKMQKLFYKTASSLKSNSSTILTVVAAGGVVITAVSTGKAAIKADKLLKAAKEKKGEDLTKTEVILTAGPAYIPPVVLGVSTIACIFGINTLNKKQQAALASAYALVENSYKDYRNKVKEMFGEEVDTQIRDSIMMEERNRDIIAYAPGCQILPQDGEIRTFYEPNRRSYFESTVEAVQNAEYHLNRNLAIRGDVTLNEFYSFLGLSETISGNVLGWDIQTLIESYESPWIDFDHRLVTLDDGLECYVIETPIPPTLEGEYEY